MEAAISVLNHTADENIVCEKMKATFSYHHSLVNDEKKGADVFSVFPRFLDTSGLVRHPHSLNNGKYPMQHAVSLMIPFYALCITDRTRFQAPVW